MLRLTTFGGLALSRDGVALTGVAAQRSRLSLLALLATAGPTGFSRDKLLLHLWPESDEERARHALKQAVYSLRRELGADEVIVGTASLSLNPLLITSDAREFEAAIAAGDLATAVSLYAGPFLDGFHLKDSSEFERWSAEQRSRFAHLWVSSVEKLAAECEVCGAWREAAGYWRTLAAAEPLSGRLALALMRALAESGDLGAALQQYRIHETLLREELGSAPEAAVSSFAESLKSGTWTRSPEPPRRSPAPQMITTISAPSLQDTKPVPVLPGRVSVGTARKRRRRSTALAFVLGMLLVTVAALTVTYVTMDEGTRAALTLIRTRPSPTLEPRRIVVAPFENKTGVDSLDPLGDLAADWFARELGEADFKVVDARTARIGTEVVRNIPRPLRADDKVALGEETGAAYVVVGNYYRSGRDSLTANISVVDVATRQTLKTLGPFVGASHRGEDFITRMLAPTVAFLRSEVDTTAGGRTTRYSSPTTTEVQARVNAAWEHFFQNPRDTATVFAELDAAALLDPAYPMPALMRAYMLDTKAQWAGVKQMVDRVRPLAPRMSKLERAALELFEADLRGNALARIGIARRLQEMSPGSTEMPLLRVVSALYVGDVTEAETALEAIDPTRGMNVKAPTYLEWATTTYHYAGHSLLEERATRQMIKRFRHEPQTVYAAARLYASRDEADLDQVLRRGISGTGRDAVVDSYELTMFAARELRAHGYDAKARELIDGVVRSLPQAAAAIGPRRQAHALYEAGDYRGARAAFEALYSQDSNDVEALGRVATASVHLGDVARARRIDERLARMHPPFSMGSVHRWRAAIAAVEGRQEEAVALLDLAVRQGYRLMDNPPNRTIHLDPDFVSVEKSAGYRAMLEALRAGGT